MIIFRIVCAVLMAWAVNWSLSRNEAIELLRVLPEMEILGPIAAAAIGFVNLSVRQGWGFIVAFANGVWASVLSVLFSGALYVVVEITRAFSNSVVRTFDNFLSIFSAVVQPLLTAVIDIPLLTISLGAGALVGVITEVVHWTLVRMKARKRGPRIN